MDLKEIGVNAKNWIDSAQKGLLESPCECSIEPRGSINYGVRYLVSYNNECGIDINMFNKRN